MQTSMVTQKPVEKIDKLINCSLILYTVNFFFCVFVGPVPASSYKIAIIGNNWLAGWLVGWLVGW